LPFAVRSGGHSYEGFSQSQSVVIDTRMLNQITFDRTARTMTVGAGATLGPIYEAIGAAGFGFPGGSCPTVGVAGHALGGGFGLIARPFGLACDNLQWLELVDPQGAIIQVDAQHNPDLFWAARGGGGGSFGAVTRFRFKIYRISQVVVLGVTWRLPLGGAKQLFKPGKPGRRTHRRTSPPSCVWATPRAASSSCIAPANRSAAWPSSVASCVR
jgi:FAD/FMN-containing dehydrogenase